MEQLRIHSSPIQGRGLFAAASIPAGSHIVEYVGDRISKTESLRRCQEENYYIFALDDEWDIDGNVERNIARFINHSCEPSCEAELSNGRVWIVARRDIASGEELTYNYGYDLVDYRDHPCRCGAASCVGYIVAEEFFPSLRRMLSYA
jgi:SET domain-containing protein